MKRLAVVALAVLALAGCSHPPDRGAVTSRRYNPAHTVVWYSHPCIAWRTVCYSTGHGGSSYPSCIATASIPNIDHYPATWQLCLRDASVPDKVRTGCRTVPETVWDQHPAGSYYSG